MLNREIKKTSDGSYTFCLTDSNESFHSIHGAIQESNHIFIQAGLRFCVEKNSPVRIFEVGYGTGLNALLTAIYCLENCIEVHYTSVEAYPITAMEHQMLNYGEITGNPQLFEQLFQSNWESKTELFSNFYLLKHRLKIQDFIPMKESMNLIYFDAFSPDIQAELWTDEIFEKMYFMLEKGGVLVTYSCKGIVKRALKKLGFSIELLAGPPGKREFLRATKL